MEPDAEMIMKPRQSCSTSVPPAVWQAFGACAGDGNAKTENKEEASMARYRIDIIDYDGKTPPTSKYTDLIIVAFDTGESMHDQQFREPCSGTGKRVGRDSKTVRVRPGGKAAEADPAPQSEEEIEGMTKSARCVRIRAPGG